MLNLKFHSTMMSLNFSTYLSKSLLNNVSKESMIKVRNGGDFMPVIAPISELRNYGQVLDKVEAGKPVYLTKNGHGEYSIHKIEDDEIFDKARAMVKLMSELNAGFASGDENGWISDAEVDKHFKDRRRKVIG